MKKKLKKGFTLIEFLAMVAILGIIISLSIYISMSVISKSKNKTYEVTINNIEQYAIQYLNENSAKLFFVSGSNQEEYQCITVGNLVDMGYFDNDITKSKISDDVTVGLNDYIYIERNSENKTVIKSVYLNSNLSNYDGVCETAINASGDIKFVVSPSSGYSKSKEVTIYYRLKNVLDTSDYENNYQYKSISGEIVTEKTNVGMSTKVTVTENGTMYAEIEGVVNASKEISGIDNEAPTCKLSVTTSGISFDTKSDNVGVTSYGINTSTTPSYLSNSASLSKGTFYGHVKDEAGNTGICSATITETEVSKTDVTTSICAREVKSYTCHKSATKNYYCDTANGYKKCSSGSDCQCYKYSKWNATKNYCSNYLNKSSCASASASCTWSYDTGECKGNFYTCSSGTRAYDSSGYYCYKYYYKNYAGYTYYCSSGTYGNDGYCYKYNQDSCGSWTVTNTEYKYYFSDFTESISGQKSVDNEQPSCNKKSDLGNSYISKATPTEYKCKIGEKLNNSYCYVIS